MRRQLLVLAAALLALAAARLALNEQALGARKRALAPGRDPGGVAIALLTAGIDTTLPEVARRLARDGEGEPIGADSAYGDNRPLSAAGPAPASAPANWGGDGTRLATALGSGGRRLVPVLISPTDPVSLARAVAFVARTPAQIVVVPMWSADPAAWEPFRQAAAHFRELLFILAAGDEGKDIDREPVWPAAWRLANALVVTAPAPAAGGQPTPNWGETLVDALVTAARGPDAEEVLSAPETSSLAAMLAADALAGCWPALVAAHRGAALKAALLAAAAKAWPGARTQTIERCRRPSPHTPSPAP
jgi:hypothetical protein